MKALAHLFVLFPLLTASLHGNPFTWTGQSGNGNWVDPGNWDVAPDFTASNATQNTYNFIFNNTSQQVQQLGNQERRFTSLLFNGGAYSLSNGNAGFLFGGGGGGITVTAGNHVISGGAFKINVFVEKSNGGLLVDNGSLTLVASDGFSIAGSSALRYLPVSGNGTVTLSGKLTTNAYGGSVLLKEGFSGRLILDTAGSTIADGELVHNGTGVVEIRANDALGALGMRFANDAARVAAGGGARTLDNTVTIDKGITLAGEETLELRGALAFTSGSRSVGVEEAGAELKFSGTVSGSSGEVVKRGAGTWVLSGDNEATWSQEIRVTEGEVRLLAESGAAAGTGRMVVGADGKLSGYGALKGEVEIEGVLTIGAEGGFHFANGLEFLDGAAILMEKDGVAGIIENDLIFGENVLLVLSADGDWAVGESYRLFNLNGGEITGSLVFSGPFQGSFSYESGPGGYLEFTLTAIPEPAAPVMALAAASLVLLGRRRLCRS